MKTKTIPIKSTPKKELLFFKSVILLKNNPTKFGLMILFDVLFLVSFFGLQKLSEYFAQGIAVPTALSSAIIFIIFLLIYYLIILLVYSFFKYVVLDYIKSLFQQTDFSFKRLGQFYSLNIVIAGIFLAIMLILSMILSGIKQTFAPFVFIFMAIPFVAVLYAVLNISHSLFYEGASLIESVKKGFKIAFTKARIYRETILTMILFALLLWLLFMGSGYLIRLVASKNYSMYLGAYAYFKQISKIVFDIVFYFVILINRISFYVIVRVDK